MHEADVKEHQNIIISDLMTEVADEYVDKFSTKPIPSLTECGWNVERRKENITFIMVK